MSLARYTILRKLTIKLPTAFDKFSPLRLSPFSIVISGRGLEGLSKPRPTGPAALGKPVSVKG